MLNHIRCESSLQVDKLERVRREMGSRKAQHRSAGCPQSHDETPVGLSQKQRLKREDRVDEAAERRARTGVRVEKDFNRTFTLGESLAHADPSSVSWQTLQALAQAAPIPPAPDVAANKKPKKKKKKRSSEGSGSSESSNTTLLGDRMGKAVPDAGHSHQSQGRNEFLQNGQQTKLDEDGRRLPVDKARLRKAGPLGPEGQRPSIERGGTNTVQMEVNGVKSPPPAQLSPEKELSPPAVTRGGVRGAGRKQRHSEPAHMFGSKEGKMAVAGPDTSPGTATRGITFTDDSPDGTSERILPDVPRPPRKKRSKYAVSGGTKGTREDRLAQSNGHHRRRGSCDNGLPAGENGSPLNRSLPDLQPFSSPERGLRGSLSQLDDSDWNEKCDGLMGVRRLAAFHTTRLIPDLHSVTLAVVKEVRTGYGTTLPA